MSASEPQIYYPAVNTNYLFML